MNTQDITILKAKEKIEIAWKCEILPALKVAYDLNWEEDFNFKDTPRRIANSLIEKCEGINLKNNKESLKKLLGARFPSSYNGIIKVGPVESFGICPHHFETVSYKVLFGYIPNEKHVNNAIGLSKMPRLIKLLAKSPILQEDYTDMIVDVFQEYIDPKGSIAIVKGQHGCMLCRGIKTGTECWVTTSAVRGEFETCDSIKQEFLNL